MTAELLGAMIWAWELIKSLTITDWLLVFVVFGLRSISSAIRWGFASLMVMLKPVRRHYRAIEQERKRREHRRDERESIGDLLSAGAATQADIDRLNQLDAEERNRRER